MARYRIHEEQTALAIEVADVGEQKVQFLEAFAQCQAGQCDCPTGEYAKLASMDVQDADGSIRIRLETKPGEKLDIDEIRACLDYTAEKLQ
jgi:hypothetical protein